MLRRTFAEIINRISSPTPQNISYCEFGCRNHSCTEKFAISCQDRTLGFLENDAAANGDQAELQQKIDS